nr:CotH kinase family protein [uncultured Bacillus sp.]
MADETAVPEYRLYIHPQEMVELRKDIWINDPLPAILKINKKKLDVDLAYRGSHIRGFKKKSYHISFYKPKVYRNAKEVHLNAEYKDISHIRNKLSLDFFSDIGSPAPASQFVFLTLNGRDEGLYLELESVDEYFLANRNLAQGAIFYAVDGDANFSLMSDLDKGVKPSLEFGYEKKCGSEEADFYLQDLIIKVNTIPRAEFEKEIMKYVHVEQYLCWLAGAVLTQNYDGFVHNYALYRSDETGLFEIFPWDYDATWGRDVHGKDMPEDYVRIEGFNTLTARILDVPSFRRRYKQLLLEIIGHQFTVDFIRPKIDAMYNLIKPYVLKDPYVKDRITLFEKEPDIICSFIQARSRFLKSEIHKLD